MNAKIVLDLVNHYATYSAIGVLGLNVLLGLFFWKELNTPFRRLLYFLIWNALIEILAFVFIQLGYNNLPLLHIYTLGEFILFSYFYKSLIDKPIVFQKSYWYLVIAASVLIILNTVFFQSIFRFNSFAKTGVQVSIIAYAVLYFYNLVENQWFSEITYKSLRLINSAILIYYSGSLFIFMHGQVSFENTQRFTIFWAFNSVLNLIFQLLILCGLCMAFCRKKTSSF